MAIKRTPIVDNQPIRLIRQQEYRRTPVISGQTTRPMADLIWDEKTDPSEIDASLKLSEIAPQLEPVWGQAHDYMLRTSLAYFMAEMISGPPEHPYNGKSLVGKHHEEWDKIISEHDAVLLEAARDHGKSHFFSVAYVIWRAGYTHPGKLGYLFSARQGLAEDLLELTKQELLTNPKLAHLLPSTADRQWSKNQIKLRNGSIIRARGMGVKVRGGHPHWILADDCLSDDDIYSETIRKRNINYFLSAIVNMVVPGGQIVVVGTPMHFGDLYGHLRESGAYFCAKYPAIDKKGTVLFPERYNRKRLEQRKKALGPARFAREFLCQPLTDEASLFPSHLFQGGHVCLPYTIGLPAAYWEEKGWLRYSGIDFAMSSSAKADYTVIFTVAVDDQGNRWLVNIRRGKGWGFQRQLDEIKEEYALTRPEIMHAEANQMQRIFTDEIIRETDIPIRKFFTSGVQPRQPWRKGMTALTMGKHHLDRGVPSLRMSLENKKWRLPRGNARSIEVTDQWIGEMTAMSWQNGQVISVGDHDDTVMACWMADSAARMGGFRFSFGEEDVPLNVGQQAAPAPTAAPVAPQNVEPVAQPPQDLVPSGDWRPNEGAPLAADLGFGGGGFGSGDNFFG